MAPERVKLGLGPSHLVARIPTGSGHSLVAAGLMALRTASGPQGSLVWVASLLSSFCKPGGFQRTEVCSSLLGLQAGHQAWLTSEGFGLWFAEWVEVASSPGTAPLGETPALAPHSRETPTEPGL